MLLCFVFDTPVSKHPPGKHRRNCYKLYLVSEPRKPVKYKKHHDQKRTLSKYNSVNSTADIVLSHKALLSFRMRAEHTVPVRRRSWNMVLDRSHRCYLSITYRPYVKPFPNSRLPRLTHAQSVALCHRGDCRLRISSRIRAPTLKTAQQSCRLFSAQTWSSNSRCPPAEKTKNAFDIITYFHCRQNTELNNDVSISDTLVNNLYTELFT